jgi:indolepyruvate ferredoxin oxidoreductase, alpha subunit
VVRLMTGLEALARGAAEKRVELVVGHPSRCVEPLLRAAEREGLQVERAPSDAVAVEVAAGASLAGARVMAALESLESAAGALHATAYVGTAAGLGLVVVDDPALAVSTVKRDSRVMARALGLPCLEPSDPGECVHHLAAAFGLAERWGAPVVIRLTVRLAFGARPVPVRATAAGVAAGLRRDPANRVLTPESGRRLRARLQERIAHLAAYAAETPLNHLERRSRALGVLTSGATYHHVREVLPEATVLKLGLSHPLPTALLRELAGAVDRVVVVEELEPVVEAELRQLGIACRGKDLLPRNGELGPDLLARVLGGAPTPVPRRMAEVPERPPELCAGCPQRAVLQAVKRLHVEVVAEPGCTAEGSRPPLSAVHCALSTGAVGVAHGAEAALGSRVRGRLVTVMGEAAFVEGGALALAQAASAGSGATIVVTQDGTGAANGAGAVDLAALARAMGAARVRAVDAYDLAGTEAALREELGRLEPSVVVARAACRAHDEARGEPCAVEAARCNRCGACLRLGCPAISDGLEAMTIDPRVCAGCGTCLQVCRARAVVRVEEVSCPPA